MDKFIEKLKNKGVLIFPTDTVYGLGTMLDKEAVNKIYTIKKRDKEKKIIALVSNKEKIKELIVINDFIEKIIDNFFPGEITIISKASKYVKEILDYDYLGVRMPNNKKALELIEAAGGVLMTTSANLSGEKACDKFSDISKELLDQVDGYIEDDSSLSGLASSIFKIENENIEELRKGNISIENLKSLKEEKIEK